MTRLQMISSVLLVVSFCPGVIRVADGGHRTHGVAADSSSEPNGVPAQTAASPSRLPPITMELLPPTRWHGGAQPRTSAKQEPGLVVVHPGPSESDRLAPPRRLTLPDRPSWSDHGARRNPLRPESAMGRRPAENTAVEPARAPVRETPAQVHTTDAEDADADIGQPQTERATSDVPARTPATVVALPASGDTRFKSPAGESVPSRTYDSLFRSRTDATAPTIHDIRHAVNKIRTGQAVQKPSRLAAAPQANHHDSPQLLDGPSATMPTSSPRRVVASQPSGSPASEPRPLALASPDAFPSLQPRVTPRQDGLARVVEGRYGQAVALAEKGALYAAEEEMIQTLWVVAQAADEHNGAERHRQALSAALLAFTEADDFAVMLGPTTSNPDASRLVASHRTPVRPDEGRTQLFAIDALQEYYNFAQDHLRQALQHEPTAARVLYGIARIYQAPSRLATPTERLSRAKAIAFLRTAVNIDPTDYAVANELGVALARLGRYEEARQALLLGLAASPQPETWQNLSTVCDKLGQKNQAREAHARFLAARAGQSQDQGAATQPVRWVDLAVFEGEAAISNDLGLRTRPAPSVELPARPVERPQNVVQNRFQKLFRWLPTSKSHGRSSTQPAPAQTAQQVDTAQQIR